MTGIKMNTSLFQSVSNRVSRSQSRSIDPYRDPWILTTEVTRFLRLVHVARGHKGVKMVDLPSHESWASEKPSPGQDLVNHSLNITGRDFSHRPELGITPTIASFKGCFKFLQIANKKSE